MAALRCKPGDLAIVVHFGGPEAQPGDVGISVTVIKLLPRGMVLRSHQGAYRLKCDDTWDCQTADGRRAAIQDKFLMPIPPKADPVGVVQTDEVMA